MAEIQTQGNELPIVFSSVKQCYGIGDTVEIAFKKSHHDASTLDWIGLFPSGSDSTCSEKPLNSKHVSNHILTEHGSDIGIQITPQIDLDEVKMRLDLDFPVESDMAEYEVRYFDESNMLLGKTDPFAISLVPLDEACDDDDRDEYKTSLDLLEDGDSTDLNLKRSVRSRVRLLEEIKRRQDAEKAVENYSRSLGEQINEVERKNEIIEQLQSNHDTELRNNEIIVEEAKELQQQVDNLSNLYAQSQASIMTLQDECARLGKELETTDKENSCLKFHIVNSEDKLESEEYVVRDLNKETGGWGESCKCKHNNQMLETALVEEREKSHKVAEAYNTMLKENDQLQANIEKLIDLQSLFEDELTNEKARSEGLEKAYIMDQEVSEKIQLELVTEREVSQQLQEQLKKTSEKLLSAEQELQTERDRLEKIKGEMKQDLERIIAEKMENVVAKLEEEAARVESGVTSHNRDLVNKTDAYNAEVENVQQYYMEYYSVQEEELNKSRSELENEIGKSRKLEQSFQSKISEIESHLSSKEEALEMQRESLSKSLEEGKTKIIELADELQRKIVIEEQMANEIKAKDQVITEYEAKLENLAANKAESASQTSNVTLQQTASQTIVSKSSDTSDATTSTGCSSPSSQLISLTISNDSIQTELKKERVSRKETDKAYERQIEELESRVANESSNASRLENELTASEVRCRETEEDVKFFRQQLLDTEKKLQDGQCLLSKTMEEMNYLKNKVRRTNFDATPHTNIAPPTAASTPLLCQQQQNGNGNNHLKSSSFEMLGSECMKDVSAFPPMNTTFTVPTNENRTPCEPKPVPGIVRYPVVSSDSFNDTPEAKQPGSLEISDQQPIPVIIEGRKVPKKKGRRFSKPINLVLPPLHTVNEHSDNDGHHHHHHKATPYVHHDRFNYQDRNQEHNVYQDRGNHIERSNHERFNGQDRGTPFDSVRQHRNSLQRENTYLKNKVSALVTDLLLMQKSLSDVVVDSEQKLSMLQLVISNQCALASAAAQSELQFCSENANSFPLGDSSVKLDIDYSNYNMSSDNDTSKTSSSNNNSAANVTSIDNLPGNFYSSEYNGNISINDNNNQNSMSNNIDNFHPSAYLSQYGVIQSPMKEKPKLPSNNNNNNNILSTRNTSPMMSKLATPSPNYLSPLAEEYTPVQRHSDAHSPHLSHSELGNSTSSADAYLDYACNQQQLQQKEYSSRSFVPSALPPTPAAQNDDELIDVTEQLESIGIRF